MSNSNESGCLTLLILLIVGVVALVWHFDFAPMSNEKTVYIRVCGDKIEKGSGCKNWKYLDPVTYTVNVDSQVVVKSTQGKPEIERLSNCAVRDRNNWSCTDVDGNITLADGGVYFGAQGVEDIEGIEQVSKLIYFKNTKFD